LDLKRIFVDLDGFNLICFFGSVFKLLCRLFFVLWFDYGLYDVE